ncbi:WD40-repeat-containing domain protein [Pisolithus marmoratus]|nr:WD40-repeat-containing domain protein [Pisolithus marmoratus]
MSFFGAGSTSAPAAAPAEKDIEVPEIPTDSISSLAFSPAADYLAVGSWDNNVRLYEVGANGQTQGKAIYGHQGPVLSVCWNKEGNKAISGGADNAARMFDITTGQPQQVAQHDAPIKVVKWIETPQGGILATGSWDKTLKYWDLRTPNPVATVQLPERCYTMDVQYPLLVVGTAERHIQIYNLTNPTTPYKTITSPLKWQTRVVSCFTNSPSSGFAVGSIEGRVAIQYVEDKDSSNNFSFKCHRKDQTPASKDQSLVYAVNDIAFHPVHGTFSTCGSDGSIHYWDKDARTRLNVLSFETAPGPITATTFNRNGTIFAYAISYDWSKGHSGMTPGHPNKLMLHACKEDEVKRRPKK